MLEVVGEVVADDDEDDNVEKVDMEKIQGVMTYYQNENARLLKELSIDKIVMKANATKIAEQDKIIRNFKKKIDANDKIAKFEKIATDGLSKKVGNLTQEVIEKTDERLALIAEQIFNRKKVAELEQFLCTTRALRLKEIHENEILKIEINNLRNTAVTDEKVNIEIKKSIIEKIISIENVNSVNTNFKYTIESQVAEIISLSKEIIIIREKNNSLLEHVRKLEEVLTVCANDNDHLKREVEKWKKKLWESRRKDQETIKSKKMKNITMDNINKNNLNICDNHGRGSQDYANNSGSSNRKQNGSGNGNGNGSAYNVDHCVSPHSTAYRSHNPQLQLQSPSFSSSQTGPLSLSLPYPNSHSQNHSTYDDSTGRYYDVATSGNNSNYSEKDSHSQSLSQSQSYTGTNVSTEHFFSRSAPTSLLPHLQENKKKKKKDRNLTHDTFTSHRSLFVGVGLGLKKENLPEFNPQGSAKSVLKNIMKNFEYEDEVID